jgi:poly(A) polymerase Pap1
MKVIIEAQAKEIADLVREIQDRQETKKTNLQIEVDGKNLASAIFNPGSHD